MKNISLNFLRTLAKENAFCHFKDIADVFRGKVLSYLGGAQILVETAQNLTKEQEERLISGLTAKLKKKIYLTYKLNENLLGGLILHYDSIQIDDSVLNKLKTIENMMKGLK